MQSLAAWQYLTTVPCAHPGSYLAAAESVLCYHLSHLPGELMIFIIFYFYFYCRVCLEIDTDLRVQ